MAAGTDMARGPGGTARARRTGRVSGGLRPVVALVVVGVMAAACGGGGASSGPGRPGTDQALIAKAQAATLQPADFTPGFAAQPEEPGQGLSIERVWQELTACLGVKVKGAPAGVATSPTYLRGLATQGRSTVEYTTEPNAAALATALAGPKAQACFTRVFAADVDRSKPEGAKPGPVTVTTRQVPPAGDKIMAWRINASVNLDELVVPLFQDFLVIFNKGTVIRMFFLNPGAEFPQDLERSLLDKVVARA